MAVGVIRAFIEKEYNKTIDAEYLKRNMKKELMEKVLERERFFFGALQRLDKPIQAIDKFIVNRQIEYGGQGNTWVMHWRTQEWLDLGVPRYNEYVKGGDEANDYLLDRTDSFLQFGNGQRVYILRTLNVDNRGEFDIMKEIAVYGEWVLAFDHTRTLLPADQYESKWRSIQIYDANEDEWAVITLEDLVRQSGRWDDNGNLRNLGEFATGQNGTMGKKDSLHVRDNAGNLRPIKRFGEISTDFFSANSVDRLADSMVRAVTKSASLTTDMTFSQAASVIREYAQRALNVPWDITLQTYLGNLVTANQAGRASADKFNNVASLALTNNSLVLPANLDNKYDVPPLLIHYAAMRAFVNSQLKQGDAFKEQVRRALVVLQGFVTQAQAITTMMSGKVDMSMYPTYLPDQNELVEMMVKNIQGREYLPGWLRMQNNPQGVADPASEAVVSQVVGLAAQAREQVENRLTGKFAMIKHSEAGVNTTNLIAANLSAAGGIANERLRLVSPQASRPTWGQTVLPLDANNLPNLDINAANTASPEGLWVLSVIHNLGTQDVVQPAMTVSTEAAKTLILTAIASIDPKMANANITAEVQKVHAVVDGIKQIRTTGLTTYTDAQVDLLADALLTMANIDRLKSLLRTVKRTYSSSKNDLQELVRQRGPGADGSTSAAAVTSGYLRTPLMISPSLFNSMMSAMVIGAPDTTFEIMPSDPSNPAQMMPNLEHYRNEATRPSILKEGESAVTLAGFQAARERVINGGNNGDRLAENSLKTAEKTLEEVVKTIRDPLKLAVASAYLTSKPTFQNVISMIKQNIVVPFSFMIQRPAISWFTYGGLKVQAGEQTAVTWFKSPVWSWQDDGVLQVYRAVLTYYSKTTVLQPKNVYLARHLLLDEYLGGMGVDFYKGGRNTRNTNLMSDKRNKHRPSILVSLEPYEVTPKTYDKLISVRGVYPTTYQYLSKNGNFHYHNADWVMAYYGLTTAAQMGAQDEESATAQPLSDAMMMWRGMARYPLPSNSGVLEYRAVSMPQGYFPDTIYGPGMRKTWDDPFTPYRHYDYSGNGFVGLAV